MESFEEVVRAHRQGVINGEMTAGLREVVEGVKLTGQRGKVVLELIVEPFKGGQEVVILSHKVAVKAPVPTSERQPYYVGENNTLEIDDPNRPRMRFPAPVPVATTAHDPNTGEVIEAGAKG